MNPSNLFPGIYRVKIDDLEFNLSVVMGFGLNGVAGYQDGEKRPRRGKHLMLTDSIRNWIERMELVERIK